MNLTGIKWESEDCVLLPQENKISYPLKCWEFFFGGGGARFWKKNPSKEVSYFEFFF